MQMPNAKGATVKTSVHLLFISVLLTYPQAGSYGIRAGLVIVSWWLSPRGLSSKAIPVAPQKRNAGGIEYILEDLVSIHTWSSSLK